MEQLLHYVWKHKLFPLKELQTTTGLAVEVIDPGLPNSDAGPDFFNAKLKIDGIRWVGNVEIHTLASDWYRHGHHTDRAYDSVILHVCGEVDRETFRTTGEEIPQLLLTTPDYLLKHYEELHRVERYPSCYPILPTLSKLTIHGWLTALQRERFEQKARAIAGRLTRCNNHWEDAFWITLSRNFGFGLNGDAFECWAQLLPFRALEKHRDNLFQVEALFFGVAGLLAEEEGDAYYGQLRSEYTYLAHKFQLAPPMDRSLWRFLRLRPGNFPTLRLAQLAYLYHREQTLFSRAMECESVLQLCQQFSAHTSPYWEEHYSFGKSSPQQGKPVGVRSQQLLLINTVIPFLYAYGLYKADDSLCDRATRLLEELKPENNQVTRRWADAGVAVESAADSQALLQLQKEYCDRKRCLYCRFGYAYLRQK